MIRLEAVTACAAEDRVAIEGIELHVAPGERVVLLGANGSGKTTLLRLLDGLIFPTTGRYFYDGQQITRRALRRTALARRFRSEVVLAFQNPEAMLFHPTVFDEIAFAPRQRGLDEERVRQVVEQWARTVGAASWLERSPWELSAGEQQKVCLAAILAVEPRLLLLDEPTASLDPRSTGWLVDFLDDLGLTTVISTHSLSLAPELGSRAVVLGEDHRLLWDGATEELLADTELLVRANLAHSHRHRHGRRIHRHFHIHDWS